MIKVNPNDNVITITIGEHIYEILKFLRAGEGYISGPVMLERAKNMNAHLGVKEALYIVEHQRDIPVDLRGKIFLVFIDCRHPSNPDFVAYLCWTFGAWNLYWVRLGCNWNGADRLARRK